MKELKIVSYIKKHELEKTISDFDLIVRQDEKRILLKYNQLSSKTLFSSKELQECRGLILEKNTWKVLSLAFTKFFNAEEGNAHVINWENAYIFEKLDGSLIQLYHYDGKWNAGTTGTFDASGNVGDNLKMTFSSLFFKVLKEKYNLDLTLLDTNLCYVFELCTPYNIVVKQHKESSATLLTIRDLNTLKELSYENVLSIGGNLDLPIVKRYNLSLKDYVSLRKSLENKPFFDEGYVVASYGEDGVVNRVKIKNLNYIAVHHLKNNTSKEAIMKIVKTNEIDEFIIVFPERKDEIIELRAKYVTLLSELKSTWEILKDVAPNDDSKESKKIYAENVFRVVKENKLEIFQGLFFNLGRDNSYNIEQFLFNFSDKHLYNYFYGY